MAEDKGDDRTIEQYDEWKKRHAEGDQSPREMFENVSKVSLLLTYDLIDKVRYYGKESLKLSDEEIGPRVEHMVRLIDRLRAAYLDFSDVDI